MLNGKQQSRCLLERHSERLSYLFVMTILRLESAQLSFHLGLFLLGSLEAQLQFLHLVFSADTKFFNDFDYTPKTEDDDNRGNFFEYSPQ